MRKCTRRGDQGGQGDRLESKAPVPAQKMFASGGLLLGVGDQPSPEPLQTFDDRASCVPAPAGPGSRPPTPRSSTRASAPGRRSPAACAPPPPAPASAPAACASRRYCACRYVPFGLAGRPRRLHQRSVRSQRFPLVVRPLCRLPALSLLPGHIPAHDARWPAVGNGSMSGPDLRHDHLRRAAARPPGSSPAAPTASAKGAEHLLDPRRSARAISPSS